MSATGIKHEINILLENQLRNYGIPARIETVLDHDLPRNRIYTEEDTTVIVLNLAKIPDNEYAAHAGYHVRQLLLPQLRLETGRLILRRYTSSDASQCFCFLSNEQDAYMDCCRSFASMDDAYYDRVALFEQRETQYIIELKHTGQVIGTVHIFPDDSRAIDAMEIGYSIAHNHQRNGYAFEALSALLDLLQKDLFLELVTAGILPENLASKKLLTKLGFCKEGLRHKAVWHESLDKPVDLIYYYRDREALRS